MGIKPGPTIHDRYAQDPTCLLLTHYVLRCAVLCSVTVMDIRSETLEHAKKALAYSPNLVRTVQKTKLLANRNTALLPYGLCQGPDQTVLVYCSEGPATRTHPAGLTPFGGLHT